MTMKRSHLKRSNPAQRRGITLLFVISMIVLFLLMGTTFVIVANDFFRESSRRSFREVHKIDATALLERGFETVVYGPELTNVSSPLRFQSLMGDIYGYEGFKGTVSAAPNPPAVAVIPGSGAAGDLPSNGQLIEIELAAAVRIMDRATAAGPFLLSDVESFYAGQVITFIDGPAKGISTRIYDYVIEDDGASPPTITARKFVIVAPRWRDSEVVDVIDLAGSQVVVNGRAFAGTGTGSYTPSNQNISALGGNTLEPNRVGEDLAVVTAAGGYLGNSNPNESYDALDWQNMYLAGRDVNDRVVASFHRESLRDYFGTGDPATATTRHLFAAFNVDITGLNVDSDGDGENDAIFIDIGSPVQSNGQGLYYKPLYAYHITEMDSRINLNVHGNHVDMLRVAAGIPATPYAGQGFGPSEISLEGFLTAFEYNNIIQGNNGSGLPGRYGFGADGIADNGNNDEVPGAPGLDTWATKKLFGSPLTTTSGLLYQSGPMDVRGRFGIQTPDSSPFADGDWPAFNNALPGIDVSTSIAADVLANHPYEANFSPSQYSRWEALDDDQPFAASELERILRPFDVDSISLADRLFNLLPTLRFDADLRKLVTTDSFEVPTHGNWLVDEAGQPQLFLDRINAKFTGSGFATRKFLLPPEIFRGRKMNLNRPFGNGLDDAAAVSDFGAGVIDEPGEVTPGFTFQRNFLDSQNPTAAMDLDNDFQPGLGGEDLVRADYARHLYVLTLLVCEDELTVTSGPIIDRDAFRTAVAQWAVNVVDFMDPDSIHTPFEFDLDPFNGWTTNAEGDLTTPTTTDTEYGLVWGTERPELLITEGIVFHDRASEDLAVDGLTTDGMNPDEDYDGRLVPRTSGFIELYHPWTQDVNHQRLPAELAANLASPVGVDLGKQTPGNYPVWRIGVKRSPMDPAFLRSIYFADLTANAPTAPITDQGAVAFHTTIGSGVLPPGSHAVIGSSGTSTTGSGASTGYRTTLGRRQTATDAVLDLDITRSITLIPNAANPTTGEVVTYEPEITGGAGEVTTTVNAVAVVIDQPRSLSFSDPDAGYPALPGNPFIPLGDGLSYTVAEDQPFDLTSDAARDAADIEAIWTNGTTDQFRTLELQRLANPLLDWDAVTNPYLTIDIAEIDLLAFNGMETNPSNSDLIGGMPIKERAANVNSGITDPGSTERGESTINERILFAVDNGVGAMATAIAGTDEHNLSYTLVETFGTVNDADDPTNATSTVPYTWLTWNNRPFMNQYELANVPFTAPRDLTTAYSRQNSARDPYTELAGAAGTAALGSQFNHVLNFYGHDGTATPEQANFYRLFDFTEVPSRYVGTETWANPSVFVNTPFNSFSNYREPGKININLVQEEVYNQMMGAYLADLSYGAFNLARNRNVSVTDPMGGAPINVDMPRPFRHAGEGNFVPRLNGAGNALVEENVDCGLMRRANPASDTESIFDVEFGGNSRLPARNVYFRNAMRQRLGNTTTIRSSVFAIWVTVGFFEVDQTGALKNINGGGDEVGADFGEAQRHRAFYMFDRSIPMAFEPGAKHNTDQGVLLKSIIE